MGLHELIETIRLERAILLLGADCGPIDCARAKSGYAYSKTFRVAFKKRLHLTPRECKDMLSRAENRQSQIERLLQILWKNTAKTAIDFSR
jgi:AraC-like DNA-binding protein